MDKGDLSYCTIFKKFNGWTEPISAVAEIFEHVGQIHCDDRDKVSVEGQHDSQKQKVLGGRMCRGSLNTDGAAKSKHATKEATTNAGAEEIKRAMNHLGFQFLSSPLEQYLFSKWSWKKMFEQVKREKDKKGMF